MHDTARVCGGCTLDNVAKKVQAFIKPEVVVLDDILQRTAFVWTDEIRVVGLRVEVDDRYYSVRCDRANGCYLLLEPAEAILVDQSL